MYLLLKSLHMSCALLSISGFILRGYWMMKGSAMLQKKAVKIVPHVVDTIFLLSGISLAFNISSNLFVQGWLLSKIFLLIVYILLGTIAFKASNKKVKTSAFFAAVLTFIYIAGIAVTKEPLSWFS